MNAAVDLSTLLQNIFAASSNQASNLFLPFCVIELKADPWNIDALDMGDLSNIDTTLPSKLCNAVSSGSIASPAMATMQLSKIEFTGLSNAVMQQPTVTGSNASINVAFGGATVPPGLTSPTALQLSGLFSIALSCCPSSDGSTCSSSAQGKTITGNFTILLENSSALFGLSFASDLTTTVNSVALTTTVKSAIFKVDPPLSVSINGILSSAFATSSGTKAIQNCLQSAFSPAILTHMGAVFTPIVQTTGTPTILSFIANSLSKIANKPGNEYYLPQQLKNASNPKIEPYTIDGTWNIPDASSFYPAAGMTICGAIGTQANPPQNEISTPNSPVPININQVVISGASNAYAFPILVANNTLSALAVFGQVSTWSPSNIAINGNFDITVNCCVTQDFKTCSSASTSNKGNGTFSASIKDCSIAATIVISADPSGKNLKATVPKLELLCDNNIIDPKNVEFTISISGVAGADVWNKQAEKIFNSPEGTLAIINNINEQFQSSSVRDQIGQIITNAINSLVGDQREALIEQIINTQTIIL